MAACVISPWLSAAGAAVPDEVYMELAASARGVHMPHDHVLRLKRCGASNMLCLTLPGGGVDAQAVHLQSLPGVLVQNEWSLVALRFNTATGQYDFSRDMEPAGAGVAIVQAQSTDHSMAAPKLGDGELEIATIGGSMVDDTIIHASNMQLGGLVVYDRHLSKAEMWAIANALYSGA